MRRSRERHTTAFVPHGYNSNSSQTLDNRPSRAKPRPRAPPARTYIPADVQDPSTGPLRRAPSHAHTPGRPGWLDVFNLPVLPAGYPRLFRTTNTRVSYFHLQTRSNGDLIQCVQSKCSQVGHPCNPSAPFCFVRTSPAHSIYLDA